MDEEQLLAMQAQQAPEDEGRATDTVVGHLTIGEIVLPRDLTDNPQVLEMLGQLFQQAGLDLQEFTVGSPNNKINPETGYPEFFSFKKLFKIAAPLALSYFAPGIGSAIGGSLLGAGAAGSATLGSGLLGAGIGALSGGGLKGALTGAALGGIGANIGSLPGGAAQGASAIGQVAPSGYGSGILGAVGKATGLSANSIPSLSGLVASGGGGGGSSFGTSLGGGISSALGGIANADAIKKAQEDQLKAQQQQLANIGTFDPSNITSDAGYQFNLAQGQQGLDRSLAAQGGLQSGRALKAAAEYNQKYADNALNSAYQRYADKTGAQNSIYGNIGNVKAQSGLAGAQNIASTASGILNPQPSIEELLKLYGRA